MRINLFFICLLIYFLNLSSAFSEINFSLSDTVINRGADNRILMEVKGSVKDMNFTSMAVVVVYDARVIDIPSVQANEENIMPNSKINTKSFDPIDSSRVLISSDRVNIKENSVFFNIEIEGLAAPDSVSFLKIEKVLLDGKEELDFTSNEAEIKVKGELVFPVETENLSNNYPNPFEFLTDFNFSIKEKSQVNFKLFNLTGVLIRESSQESGSSKFFEIFTIDMKKFDSNNEELEKGRYKLRLNASRIQLSSGLYVLVMTTKNGVYHKIIMLYK